MKPYRSRAPPRGKGRTTMSEKKSVMGEVMENMKAKAKQRRAEQPAFRAQLGAMGREAAKDINSKLHEVFFGQSAGMNEPGTPLAPTQAMVTEDLTGKDVNAQDRMVAETAEKE